MSVATDTIVAVSSPPGVAARGIVRLSGPDTMTILGAMVEPVPSEAQRMARVQLRSPGIAAWCVAFRGPHSYTGEDVAELQLPGNPALLERVLHQAVAAGARLAEAGEFTCRAYLSGRIDLTQAEGVAATIAAASDAELAAAAMLRDGELGSLAAALVERLASQLALVEAGIDFTDQEDVVPVTPAALDAALAAVGLEVADVLARARPWKAIESLPWVVLVGEPSSGKSTLFNALLGRRRAVVSAVPGTTRDVLAEPLQLTNSRGGRIEVMLVDIAGLDSPRAQLDEQVQTAARHAIARAEVILQMNQPGARHGVTALYVRTKADLLPPTDPRDDVSVSAVTGEGLDELRRLIADRLGDRGVSLAGDLLTLQPRHEAALRAAAGHLQQTRDMLADHLHDAALPAPERLAAALRAALDELAALGGRMTPDDVIGRIFATFCIGK